MRDLRGSSSSLFKANITRRRDDRVFDVRLTSPLFCFGAGRRPSRLPSAYWGNSETNLLQGLDS